MASGEHALTSKPPAHRHARTQQASQPWELLSTVVTRTGHAEVVEGIIEYLAELYDPVSVEFVEYLNGREQQPVSFPRPRRYPAPVPFEADRPGPDAWAIGTDSFCVRLRHSGQLLAGITVRGVGLPSELHDHLNSALAVSGVLALALATARSSAAVRRTEEQFRQIADQSQEAVWRLIWDPEPRVVYLSPSFELITGFPAREVVADPAVADVLWPGWLSGPPAARRLDNRYEVTVARPDGSTAILEVRASVVPGGLQGLARDVTAAVDLRQSVAFNQRPHGRGPGIEEGLVITERDGSVLYANSAANRMLRMGKPELHAQRPAGTAWRAFAEDGRELAPHELPHALAYRDQRPVTDLVVGLDRHDGSRIWLLVSADTLQVGPDPSQRNVVTAFSDITALHESDDAAQPGALADRLLRTGYLRGPTALATIDWTREPTFQWVNEQLCQLLEQRPEAMIGRPVAELVHLRDRSAIRAAGNELKAHPEDRATLECRLLAASGDPVWVQAVLTPLRVHARGGGDPRDHPGQGVGQVLCQLNDITPLRQAQQGLRVPELHDPLTGMPSSALLVEHLGGALSRAARSGRLVAIGFLDLDGFTALNEQAGREVGDELLVKVANRISGTLRRSDFAARIGDDAFVVICEGLSSLTDVERIADSLVASLESGIVAGGRRLRCTLSVGVTTGTGGSRAGDLLREADAALVRAQELGGNQWQAAASASPGPAVRMLDFETELELALARDEMRLHYQPIIDLRDGRLASVEALLRWQHPTRGELAPGGFLRAAEQRNLMGHIGAWVIRTACAKAASWQARYGDRSPTIAVNVSPLQLGGGQLDGLLVQSLAEHNLPPESLRLEIAENVPLTADHRADLRNLIQLGIQLAIDDFGTGHTGYDYLRQLPISQLKIDRSFVAGLGVDPTDTAIVASLIALGRSLGVSVVAEGVETNRQEVRLRELGCTLGQGWLWAKALDDAQIDRLVAAGATGPSGSDRGRS